MNVGVIVLTWNAAEAAVRCLQTLMGQRRMPERVLVVDNASVDGTVEAFQQRFPDVPIVRNARNLGFAAGMNVGIRQLQALPTPPDIVVLLNQDTELEPDWLDWLLTPFADDDVGAVGCKIRYPNGTIQHAGMYLEWPRAVAQHVGWYEADTGQHDTPRHVDFVTGAALALRMTALNQVGLLDEGYTPAYYEDTDLCWRLRRAGYRIVYEPRAIVTHAESLSISDPVTRSSYYNSGRLRFVLKSYACAELIGALDASERAFIEQHGRGAEARALRWAYLAILANLPEIMQARQLFHPDDPADAPKTITELLLTWKQTLAQALQRRSQAALATLHPL